MMLRDLRARSRLAVAACAAAIAGNAARTAAADSPPAVEVRVLETVPLPGGGRGSFQLGGLSDLCRGGGVDGLWTLTDRGPNGVVDGDRRGGPRRTLASPSFTPLLVEVSLRGDDGRLRVLRTVPIKDPAGRPTSGRPPGGPNDRAIVDPTDGNRLEWDRCGLDPEGLVRLRDGRFWIAEEYGPSLVEVSPAGRILGRYVPRGHVIPGAPAQVHGVLPAAYARRRDNRGFECLGCSPDESRLFCLLQSPFGDGADAAAAAGNVRLLVFDPTSRCPVAEHVYRLGPPRSRGSRRAADGKISALTCVAADRLLVIEQSDDESRVYEIGLADATDVLNRDEQTDEGSPLDEIDDLAANDIRPVRKTLVADLAPLAARFQRDIEPGGDGRAPKKLAELKFEGLTVLADGRIAILNDNDFDVVADGSTAASPPRRRSCLWILTVPDWPRPE